jgi:hypothetical protein
MITSALGRLNRLRHSRDLHHHARARIMRLLHQVAGIAQRERDHGRPRRERVAKRLGIEQLRHVVDRVGPVGQIPHLVDIVLDGGGGAEQRADAAEAALIGHGRREFGRRGRSHRREDDRDLDAQKIT